MAAQSNDPVVSLTDVFKTYKVGEVDVPAVKGVTFSIPRRRFSVIVGPSGSGRSRRSRPPAAESAEWGPEATRRDRPCAREGT
jgi:ABC-type glutathione transport system ATPase component